MELAATRDILADLIGYPTVSFDGNLALIAYAAGRLSDCGARISIMPDETGQKANLFASLGPEIDGGIVLSGHTDVVPAEESEWQSNPFELREADDLLFGRGTCDMKGFIAATLAMAPHYAALDLKRPVHFAFTFDEEVGCFGAQQLVAELQRQEIRPSVAIIGEPTEMRIIEGHKGCYEYTTEFTGFEGHASTPDLGVNAIEYAVRYVSRLLEIGADLKQNAPVNRFTPPWTTIQTGCFHGGSARNVIAGHCAIDWEMRPVRRADVDYVKRTIRAYCEEILLPAMQAVSPDAGIVTHVVGEIEGLEPTDDNEARAIVSALTGATDADVVSFGTEAGLFQQIGISTVVCGPGSIAQAHKPDEFVSLPQLQACLDMLSGLQDRLTA
ncbi:acetylornithine deacetylase [Rhizobium halophytocola]|uniref:Acetylornithine deacetylase n=1 Tax=Rhizobium halophytocola TaxID=735519 RepID=A0ABS4DUW8_9HYPH|nr:acetylornithine deacetylase [Rhizobium halophytocola]MBP1849493.1 acetylornithine deacetylase [Rhizobium halophytocola]